MAARKSSAAVPASTESEPATNGKHDLVTPGAWVILRGAGELRAKHRKRALANRVGALKMDPNTGKPLDFEARLALLAQMDAAEDVAAMLVADWHIPYLDDPQQLPDTDPTLIEELTIDDNNRLLELTEETRLLLTGPTRPVDPSDYADPDSPSKPASA